MLCSESCSSSLLPGKSTPAPHQSDHTVCGGFSPGCGSSAGVRKPGFDSIRHHCLPSIRLRSVFLRFLEEALKNPATASPLFFPETVFAAPASHIAVLLINTPLACTLVGDPATYLQGMVLGIEWLENGSVDACIVVGAEETSWVLADALSLFDRSSIIGCGAGAVCLSLNPALSMGVELKGITDEHTYSAHKSRAEAARAMREQLPCCQAGRILFDSTSGNRRIDSPEVAAWKDWTGSRRSVKRILGEGLMASGAWQCVAACDSLLRGECGSALVSLVGSNQHAVGAVFSKSGRSEAGVSTETK